MFVSFMMPQDSTFMDPRKNRSGKFSRAGYQSETDHVLVTGTARLGLKCRSHLKSFARPPRCQGVFGPGRLCQLQNPQLFGWKKCEGWDQSHEIRRA